MQFGAFVAVFLATMVGIKLTYPDVQSYPREFEGGLERELGGPGATRVCLSFSGLNATAMLLPKC